MTGQERAEAKKQERDERLAPRPCILASCGKIFIPKRIQDWKSQYCCKEHQAAFWIEANRMSSALLKGGAAVVPAREPMPNSEFRPGVSHRQQVLDVLQKHANEWVEHPRQILPGVVWNSRIADLRRRGYKIESRMVGKRRFQFGGARPKFLPGGTVEYQYKLVTEG